jgi:hypothetical protein
MLRDANAPRNSETSNEDAPAYHLPVILSEDSPRPLSVMSEDRRY